MEPFYQYFPEVAQRQTRSVTLLWPQRGLPKGEYAFIELYCTEFQCDCRNVLLNVVERRKGHLASINYGLDPDEFKDVGMPQVFLDQLNKQTRYSPVLLDLFRDMVLDKTYQERLEQHLAMMKDKINKDKEGETPRSKLSPGQRLTRFIEELRNVPLRKIMEEIIHPCLEYRRRQLTLL